MLKIREDWKDIEGFEDYTIDEKGNIYSKRKRKYLKQTINKFGYCKVTLQKDKYKKVFSVHRLVAQAFIPNPKNKPQVNHIDSNRQNNNVKNLEWVTHKEQKTHEIKNGLCDKNIEALKISNKKRAIPIIFKENKYSSVREASRKTGICQWTIRKYGREVMPNE